MPCAATGLIKVCLSYEHGLLPGNLHYKEPNPNNESLKAGIIKARAQPCTASLALFLRRLIESSAGTGRSSC